MTPSTAISARNRLGRYGVECQSSIISSLVFPYSNQTARINFNDENEAWILSDIESIRKDMIFPDDARSSRVNDD